MSGFPNSDQAPKWPPQPPQNAAQISAFAGLNFAFAAICLLGVLGMGGVLIYGIFYSGDEGSELAAGVFGSLIVASPAALGVVVYSLAGFGLLRRRTWGYYAHLAGAVLAALTCVGAIYTIVALIFSTRSEFSSAFFPSTAPYSEIPR
jgi:hypothetical protein